MPDAVSSSSSGDIRPAPGQLRWSSPGDWEGILRRVVMDAEKPAARLDTRSSLPTQELPFPRDL